MSSVRRVRFAGDRGDQRLHEKLALGRVGFEVGGDYLLLNAPSHFDQGCANRMRMLPPDSSAGGQ